MPVTEANRAMSKPQRRGKLRNPPKGRKYATIAAAIVVLVAIGSGAFLYVSHDYGVFPLSSTTASSTLSTSASLSSGATNTTAVATTSVPTAFPNTPCTSTPTNGPGTYALICTNLGLIDVQLSNSSIVNATVENFISLSKANFYNDLVWHRIVAGFVIQTGDPNTRNGGGDRSTWGQGTSGRSVPFQDDPSLPNDAGYIAMASTGAGVGGSSQFYINVANNTSLNGNYAVFGKVVNGMSVVQSLSNVPVNTDSSSPELDQPVTPSSAYIVNITIQTVP
jgi:cyclophilin family peptidyl-prolyl cis-trans isomerase